MDVDFNSREELEDYILKRIKNDKPYAQITNNIYVCCKSTGFDEELGRAYAKAYKDTSLAKWIDEPHLFKLVNDIYLFMRRTSKDQCLTLFGIDKKIEHVFAMAQYINLLCGESSRVIKLTNKFNSALKVILAMSTVAEDRRCGLNIQFQFNSTGKWVGAFIQEGPFDKLRTVCYKKGLRNYDLFYALLAGCPESDRVKWHLGDPALYRITVGDISPKDHALFEDLNTSFSAIGFSAEMMSLFWQIIAGLLHLSNINFTTTDTTAHQKSTTVSNTNDLELVAGLFGVDPKSIEASLTVATSWINNASCTQLLNIKESEEQRDLLIRQTYVILFSWIIEFSNKKLNSSEFANSIWVVDAITINSKDKLNDLFSLLNNCLYETISKLFIDKGLLEPLTNQQNEGQSIVFPFKPDFTTNELIFNDNGILQILDKESIKKSNFGSVNQAIKNNCGDHAKFAIGRSSSSFGISHFNATVYYDCSLMIPENATQISPDLISLYSGSAEFGPSTNGILIKLSSPKTIKSISQIHLNLLPWQSKKTTNTTLISKFINFNKSIHSRYNNCKFWALHHLKDLKELKQLYDFTKCKTMLLDVPISRIEFNKYNTLPTEMPGPIYSGKSLIFINTVQYRQLEFKQRLLTNLKNDKENDNTSTLDIQSVYSEDDTASQISSRPSDEADLSDAFSVVEDINLVNNHAKGQSSAPAIKQTPTRRRWLCFVKTTTFCCFSKVLTKLGMAHDEVQLAFKEKLALNLIILLISGFMLFFIIALGPILCPIQKVYTLAELSTRRGLTDALVAMNGKAFALSDVISISTEHSANQYTLVDGFGGMDIDYSLFYVRRPEFYCQGAKSGLQLMINPTTIDPNATQFQSYHNIMSNPAKIDTFISSTKVVRTIAWDASTLMSLTTLPDSPKFLTIIGQNVYDLTGLVNNVNNVDYQFLDKYATGLTKLLISNIGGVLNNNAVNQLMRNPSFNKCLNSLFYTGVVDTRNTFQCQLSNYLLLSTSVFMVILIMFKFLAALRSVGKSNPTGLDKYVIIQVPCYTESLQSLTKTINSITLMDYEDKCKLMFIICDGMVVGSENDLPTSDLILQILGIQNQSESLSFQSIGSGSKQHNMAKIYSGLYEMEGHLVPFIVVVKVGTPFERIKPGNRGKRDSQMLLMRFMNKVIYSLSMSPMELELYHHMKNVIGVAPIKYDLLLMVDADTEVEEKSLSHLVSTMMEDKKIIGLCGETKLANEDQSWSTMIQVYEYYISHHLSKAFESMFGSVTCLPGCFCMYRIHQENTAYLVNHQIIKAYGEVNVDTLHLKNLLSLGEDRYLTTLMLKHFPYNKMSFNPRAKCLTIAPDRYSVLLSQRRRWINSTVHNLAELLFINQMCGFCLFSMRFVVFIDLFSTIVQPAGIIYLFYLLFTIAYNYITLQPDRQLPLVSLYLLAAVYGMQALIFIMKREFQHIGWMVIYLLATPIFGFMLPVYAFWHMDDFSWGNTRTIVGEDGKKVTTVKNREEFDINEIPHKKWEEYELQVSMALNGEYKESINNNPYESAHLMPGDLPISPTSGGIRQRNPYSEEMMPMEQELHGPSDYEIYTECKRILMGKDLMTITKKQVRLELSLYFKMEMSYKKEYINQCIDQILLELETQG